MIVKGKRLIIATFVFMLVLGNVFFMASFADIPQVYAMEDNVGSEGVFNGSITEDDKGVGDWISKQRGMTNDQLNTASRTLSPLTNMAGYFVGGCVAVIFAGVFVMTGLDLIYITIPPVRSLLYDGANQQGGMQGGMGMGGMGYGQGMMGGGMMGGGQQQGAKPRQWISDEAVQCAALMGGAQQQGGMQGGMGMGGMMGGAQQQQPMNTKSVISVYFKKRIFFMILLAICAIVLTSSALLGTGVNLAEWLLKLIDMVNGYVPE